MGTAKCYILCIRLQHLQPSLHLCEPRNLLEQKTHRLLIEHCYETITRMIFSAERVEIFAPESTRVNNNCGYYNDVILAVHRLRHALRHRLRHYPLTLDKTGYLNDCTGKITSLRTSPSRNNQQIMDFG